MPELVVVFNARRDLAAAWAAEPFVPDDLTVLADPDAVLYDALEARRVGVANLVLRALPGALAAAAHGILPHATKADMQRLGADVVVDAGGRIVLLHRAATASDRLDPARLADAVQR